MGTFTNTKWSNLPTHKPSVDLWDRIETDLDVEVVSSNVDKLPEYSPKADLWNSINRSLFFHQYLKYIYISGLALTIAGVLSLFIPDKEKGGNKVVNKDLKQKFSLANNNVNNLNKNNQLNKVADKTIPSSNEKEIKTNSEPRNSFKEKAAIVPNKLFKDSKHALEIPIKKIKEDKYIDKGFINNQEPNNPIIKDNINIKKKKEKINVSDYNKDNTTNDIPKQNNTVETKQEALISDSTSKLSETSKENIKVIDKIPLSKLDITKSSTEKQWYYSLGIAYCYNVIKNNNKFSYSDTKNISQYGVTGKITYANWVFQTGIDYSHFNDYINYNANVRINKYLTFNYVDSVIYSPSGTISQYVTHPVTINNYKDTSQNLSATRKYSLLNIPIIIGYQWRINKVAITLKTGLECSLIIYEKEELQQQENNMTILELQPIKATIRKTNWAGLLSIEIGYNFHKHLGITLEPVIQYHFNTAYNEMNSNTGLPYTIGIKAGLFYNF